MRQAVGDREARSAISFRSGRAPEILVRLGEFQRAAGGNTQTRTSLLANRGKAGLGRQEHRHQASPSYGVNTLNDGIGLSITTTIESPYFSVAIGGPLITVAEPTWYAPS